ncbi:MAG: M15 family metallopeptidase [Pseudolabrys sp.]|nr:M15 family metallopeptidase [Pseudolabrys sp.]
MRRRLLSVVFFAVAVPALAQERLPAGFVYLRDVDPSIAQDMRYATANNFVGRPLPGYDGRECVLRLKAAEALKRVQGDLARSNLSLKVYDCYRPARAVRAFAQWAQDGRSDGVKQFYPTLPKETLFRSGYISGASLHSNGTAVDLTIVPAQSTAPTPGAGHYGPCTAPAAQRVPDNSLDMGTGFDCFDTKSYTNSPAIDAGQKQSRTTLLHAMTRHGFKNYFREWWHFAYPIGEPAQQFDFPIPVRR